jgi:hypothetical protein
MTVLIAMMVIVFTAPPVSAQTVPPEDPLLSERTIIAVFEDLLGREPSRREVREWRSRSEGMTVEELEYEIRRTREFRSLTPERIITEAYRDLLERDPDPDGMRNYRRRIIERDWTAGDVRNAIRSSDEYRTKVADVIIDRAFDDLLERLPTGPERSEYRRRLLKDGTEDGIRRNIKKTDEYKYTIPREKITRAYQEILGREPDPEGLEHYRKRMINDGWSIDRVREALLKSPEYRKKYPKK